MNKKKMKQVVFEIMGVLISFLVLIPFLMVFLNSMKSKRQANLLQLSLTGISWEQFLENYGTVIRAASALLSWICQFWVRRSFSPKEVAAFCRALRRVSIFVVCSSISFRSTLFRAVRASTDLSFLSN